jgi:hypothetical protein
MSDSKTTSSSSTFTITDSNNYTNNDTNLIIQQAKANAIKMAKARITVNTSKGYQSQIKNLEKWVIQNYGREFQEFKAPIPASIVEAYFGDLTSRSKPLSKSIVQTAKSALRWWYEENGTEIEHNLNKKLNSIISGYKRAISELKRQGKMKLKEGKSPLSFKNYKLLVQKIIKFSPLNSNSNSEQESKYEQNYNQNIFAWAYLVLQWNLMARANNVATIMLNHIFWSEDSMIIAIPKSKTDQEGDCDYPRHIYANPFEPSICPVLAVAVNIFSRNFSCIDQDYNFNCLFDGGNQEDRFSKILSKVLSSLTDEEKKMLGVSTKELGTHSCRKGSTTYCNGMVGGPNPISIHLRAGWKLGDVQDRYIFAADGADQFCGRVITGLSNTSSDFSVLPPHFTRNVTDIVGIKFWIHIFGEAYNKFPNNFWEVLNFLLASIIYHRNWLHENLPKSHPLFSTILYSSKNYIHRLSPYVVLQSDLIKETGIPPHLTLAKELKVIQDNINKCTLSIIHQSEDLPKSLKEEILKHFAISGAIPVTLDKLQELIDKSVKQIKEQIQETRITENCNTSSHSNSNNPFNNNDKFIYHYWKTKGEWHMVPEDFKLENDKLNMRSIWNHWWCGNTELKIRPYRKLTPRDLSCKVEKNLLSKIGGVMNFMMKVAVEAKLNLLKDNSIEGLDDDNLMNLLDDVYPLAVDKLYRDKSRRINQASIVTLYEKIIQLNNKRKPEKKDNFEDKNNNNEQNNSTTSNSGSIDHDSETNLIQLLDHAAATVTTDPETSLIAANLNTRDRKRKKRKTAHTTITTRQTTLNLTNNESNTIIMDTTN